MFIQWRWALSWLSRFSPFCVNLFPFLLETRYKTKTKSEEKIKISSTYCPFLLFILTVPGPGHLAIFICCWRFLQCNSCLPPCPITTFPSQLLLCCTLKRETCALVTKMLPVRFCTLRSTPGQSVAIVPRMTRITTWSTCAYKLQNSRAAWPVDSTVNSQVPLALACLPFPLDWGSCSILRFVVTIN